MKYVASYLIVILVIVVGCSRTKYVDPKTVDDTSKNSFQSLQGQWALSTGETISIESSSFFDLRCNRNGKIGNVNYKSACNSGVLLCGSFEFSVGPFNPAIGCDSPGVTVCQFELQGNTPQALALRCANRARNLEYLYIKK